ncbi:hypothetical protein RJ55_07078 [Drechmeria coniospora]|nr:hypothetical protein RJ55_07078 [Drechmeria coniospora]
MHRSQDSTMRILLALVAAAAALAHPASDEAMAKFGKCPALDTAAKVAKYRKYFDENLLGHLRQCVPSHGAYQPYQGIADMSYLSRSSKKDPGCVSTVRNYGCSHGLTCYYQEKCVKKLNCGGQDVTSCHIEKCQEHTREMRCVMMQRPPAGMVHEIDHMDIMMQVGHIPVFGAVSVRLHVDGEVHEMPMFKTLKSGGTAHATVDFMKLFGKKKMPIESIEDFELIFNGQQDLTYAALAVCNRKFQAQAIKITIREVSSGLFFQEDIVYTDPATGEANFKVEGDCRAQNQSILNTAMPFWVFESQTGGFRESPLMKKCSEIWPGPPECAKLRQNGGYGS